MKKSSSLTVLALKLDLSVAISVELGRQNTLFLLTFFLQKYNYIMVIGAFAVKTP